MYWEKLRVSFLVEVDVAGIVTARMKKAMAQAKPGDWKIYADAAEYLLEQDADLAQALTWIDHSVRINQNPENLHVKAKLQMLAGQGAEAQKTLEQALKLGRSKGAPPSVTGPLESTRSSWAQANPGTLKNGPNLSPHRP
jgi:Tfp pilus assembly protein PilF